MAPITMFFPDFRGQYHDPASQQERDAFPVAARTIPHSVCGVWTIGGKAIPVAKAKVGRNDPCPCGSGRKFKQCCDR